MYIIHIYNQYHSCYPMNYLPRYYTYSSKVSGCCKKTWTPGLPKLISSPFLARGAPASAFSATLDANPRGSAMIGVRREGIGVFGCLFGHEEGHSCSFLAENIKEFHCVKGVWIVIMENHEKTYQHDEDVVGI